MIRLDLALSAAQIGSFEWDMVDDSLIWDEQVCRIFGLDPEAFEPRGSTFWSRVFPEDLVRVERVVEEAVTTCGDWSAEYRIRHDDGTVRWIDASGKVLPGPDGTGRRVIGVVRDSTELRSARDTVARALEHMADAFVALDERWNVTYLNRPAELLFTSGAAAAGQRLWDVWPTLVVEGHDQVFREAARTGETRVVTTYVVNASSWYQLRIVPATDGVGGLSVFGIDVTDAREAERARARELSRPEQARRVLAYTAALSQADSLQDVTETVATMVLPAFGASGMLVSLVESGRLRLVGHSGYQPEAVESIDLLALDDDTPFGRVLQTRQALFLPSRQHVLALFPAMARLAGSGATQSWAFLPLTVGGRALGSLTVSFDTAQEFGIEERSLLDSVSGLVGQTLARARLRDSERSLASELQSHLLPRDLPRPDGVTAHARYLPATDGMGVGGDWYDVLLLPGNRIGLVIGDVQGHNMKAAAVMGQLRNALRAYATEGHEPAAVLSRTNSLMSELDPALFATCCYVALDLLSGRADLVVAGHPPPLVRRSDGRVLEMAAPVGPPLGVAPEEEYRSAQVHLSLGDILVLFTDGLVEDSRRPLEVGMSEVMTRLQRADSDDLGGLADALVADATASGNRSDDIAVLVVRHDGLPDAARPVHQRASVDRADPRAARAARDMIARFLEGAGLVELRDTCVLLVSEVVTNALRHTDGRITLELWRYPDRLRVEVSDETSRGVVHSGGDVLDEAGRGVPLMDALSSRWGTRPRGDGKVVWFELDLAGETPGPAG